MDQMTYWVVASIIGLFTLAITLLSGSFIFGARIARLEVRVDTIWEFLMKKAIGEALSKGVATMNSPLVPHEQVYEWFKDLKDDLEKWYKEQGAGKTDNELALLVEQKFGDKILKEISLPHDLTHSAALVVAIAIAKGTTKEVKETPKKDAT